MRLLKDAIQNAEVKLPNALSLKLEDFKQTYTLNNTLRRINHGNMIDSIAEAWTRTAGTTQIQIEELMVKKDDLSFIDDNNKIVHKMAKEDWALDLPLDRIIVNRAMVKLRANLGESYNPCLAIKMSADGEEFAFGEDVKLCNNFTILQAERRFSTQDLYRGKSKEAYSLKAIVSEVEKWLGHTAQIYELDTALIEMLKTCEVDKKDWYAFVGDLFAKIQFVNNARLQRNIATLPKETKELAITSAQLGRIAVEGEKPAHLEYAFSEEGIGTAWNLVNFGTEQLKYHRTNDADTLLQANGRWVEAVKKEFLPVSLN